MFCDFCRHGKTFALVGVTITAALTLFTWQRLKTKRRTRRRAKLACSSSDLTDVDSMLLGVAIGDAFGAGIEFQDSEWISRNVDFTKWVNQRGRY